MTTIVVDIGNARLKWAPAAAGVIDAPAFVAHQGSAGDALAAAVAAFPERTERIVVANVAGDAIAERLTALTRRRFDLTPRFLQPAVEAFGVRCGYQEPARLGVDRWITVIAAHHAATTLAGAARAACVINAGTALTLDAVDASGRHLGGLIMPGPRIAADALARNTSRIGATALATAAPPIGLDLFGRSTDEAVGHAALLGPAAAFDRAISIVERELDQAPIVFLAGGDARLLEPWLETEVQLRADFVLEGLALIAAATPRPRRRSGADAD